MMYAVEYERFTFHLWFQWSSTVAGNTMFSETWFLRAEIVHF